MNGYWRRMIRVVAVLTIVVFIAVALFTQQTPKEEITPARSTEVEGDWTHKCVFDKFVEYTWTTHPKINGLEFIVEARFDFTAWKDPKMLAFKIYNPIYEPDWLWIRQNGEFLPDISYFRNGKWMRTYPGGYDTFKSNLDNLRIDWVQLYNELFTTWEKRPDPCEQEYKIPEVCPANIFS